MEQFLGATCAILSIGFIWPQVWRSLRHNTTHGISPFGMIHGLLGSTLWLTYGIIEGIFPVALANASFITAQSLIIFVAYRNGHIGGRVLSATYPVVAGMLIVLTQLPASPVGLTAVLVSGSSIIPQFIHVLRTDNLHGISITSYILTITNCTSWLLYGFVISDLMISAQNFVAVPIFTYVTWRAWRWRVNNSAALTPVTN
jgi:MtN3 and saliva related transmembrane protein